MSDWTVTTHSSDGTKFGAKIVSPAVQAYIPRVHATEMGARDAAVAWIARWEKSLREVPNEQPIEQTFEVTSEEIDRAIAALEPPADEPPADEPPADEPPADEPPADEPPADEPPAEEVP